MMYHFFNIRTYSPQSTKVSLRYVVKYVKIYIWAKWDLGTLGGGKAFIFYKFIQILFQIGWISLNGTAGYSLHVAINTKDQVFFLLQK